MRLCCAVSRSWKCEHGKVLGLLTTRSGVSIVDLAPRLFSCHFRYERWHASRYIRVGQIVELVHIHFLSIVICLELFHRVCYCQSFDLDSCGVSHCRGTFTVSDKHKVMHTIKISQNAPLHFPDASSCRQKSSVVARLHTLTNCLSDNSDCTDKLVVFDRYLLSPLTTDHQLLSLDRLDQKRIQQSISPHFTCTFDEVSIDILNLCLVAPPHVR